MDILYLCKYFNDMEIIVVDDTTIKNNYNKKNKLKNYFDFHAKRFHNVLKMTECKCEIYCSEELKKKIKS